jgi:hypothetical protein
MRAAARLPRPSPMKTMGNMQHEDAMIAARPTARPAPVTTRAPLPPGPSDGDGVAVDTVDLMQWETIGIVEVGAAPDASTE